MTAWMIAARARLRALQWMIAARARLRALQQLVIRRQRSIRRRIRLWLSGRVGP